MRSLWKRWDRQMGNKEAYRGVGQVFRFSLQQYFKQKATFVMLIVMLIASVGSVYIMSVSMNRGQEANRDGEVLYVLNESPYPARKTRQVRAKSSRTRLTRQGRRSP